jgi:hypothetical protein
MMGWDCRRRTSTQVVVARKRKEMKEVRMKLTCPRTRCRRKRVDDYLRRGRRQSRLSTKTAEGDGKTPTWLVLSPSSPFVCPLSKPSSLPPLVRGNVPYFRLVKGERATNHWASSPHTAKPDLAPMHLLNSYVHWRWVAARLLRSANDRQAGVISAPTKHVACTCMSLEKTVFNQEHITVPKGSLDEGLTSWSPLFYETV